MGFLSGPWGVDATKRGTFASYDIGYWRNPEVDPKRVRQSLVVLHINRLSIKEYKDAYDKLLPGQADEYGEENTLFRAVVFTPSSKLRAESEILTHAQVLEIGKKAQKLETELDVAIRSKPGRKAIPDVNIENLAGILGIKLHRNQPGDPIIAEAYGLNA